MQGTDDTLFTLHEAIVNFKALQAQGVPVQMLWFCGGLTGGPVAHGVCNTPVGPDPHIDTDYALRWLDHYLKSSGGSVGPRFSWVSDAGVLRGAADYPVAQDAPVKAMGSGTLVMAAGHTSGALIEAQPATNAVDVNLPTPAAGTEMLGEPTLTLTYSGTAANSDGRAYAQIVDHGSNLVLGNQATPIPLTLDGATHTITRPLEAIAADVTAGKSYSLQITDGSDVYFAARQTGVVNFSSVDLSVPTVARNAGTPVAPVSPPPVKACPAATGRLSDRSLGPVTLGVTRKNTRRALRFSATRGQTYTDFFCLTPIGIRVSYAGPKLLQAQSRVTRRRLRGRAVLILTANRRYSLRGVRSGGPLAPVGPQAPCRASVQGRPEHLVLRIPQGRQRHPQGSPRRHSGDRPRQPAAHDGTDSPAPLPQKLLLALDQLGARRAPARQRRSRRSIARLARLTASP